MKTALAASAVVILSFSAPSFSQTAGAAPPNGTGADLGGLPESMRIQQQVDRQNAANPTALIAKPGATTSDAPGGARSPVEQNRLDPSAPSPLRLQIDEGASARAVQNPNSNVANPSATGNFNTIIEGAPSSSGTSSGVSGAGPSSVVTTPSISPSGSTGVLGTSGAPSSSRAGAASSSGSSGGGR